ncbi:MAG: UbiX family flavin prenyltransferase [Cellvibrionales bacterium]|nr:UbiX family flavin prenyltransferase [Cellvibrionales bacterium]
MKETKPYNKTIALALTGASGFVYALRLLEELIRLDCQVYCVISEGAKAVAKLEEGFVIPDAPSDQRQAFVNRLNLSLSSDDQFICYQANDWMSPMASGSASIDAMAVVPCSTGTLASIAMGLSESLIKRAAVVCLKEQRPLLLMPRETPLSAIQLEHMHKLALMGVSILPASPGFYHKPQNIEQLVDFIVARILSQLGLNQALVSPWGGE